MNLKRLFWLPALLVIAACGGNGAPDQAASDESPVAVEDIGADDQPAAENTADAAVATAQSAAADAADAPTSARFQLGTHYERLSPTQPTSSSPDKVEVTEVFWYGCPHCYAFDPYIKRWLETKPDYVSFVRLPAVWNPLLQTHARAFYTAEALGKGAEMHDAFFREIHENHNYLDTEDKLRDFFGKFGVDAATFKQTFDSFAVHAKLQRADELNRRYRVSSVPTMVVNGKFTTDASSAGGYEQLFDLIDELAAAEHAGK
jgi:protein dithiol oxidoreductase (disulfide-forming)